MGYCQKISQMKFGIALLAVAFAADQCYVCVPDTKTEDQCKSLEDKQLKTCDKGQCYTVQYTNVVGLQAKNFYARGCTNDDDTKEYDNGCVTTAKSGSICYKGCTGNKCNNHSGLTSSATTATFSFMTALFYMFA